MNKEKDHLEWLNRKEEARLNNERMVASMPRRYSDYKHLCGFDGCNKAGSITSSTSGSESWYCSTHYAMK